MRPGDSGARAPYLARLHTQWRGSWRQGSQRHGDGGGLRTVSTTGYPEGDRLLGISTDPLGCPVAAELPSLLLIPVDATFPQRGEGCQGQGVRGLGVGLAEQGGRCRRG